MAARAADRRQGHAAVFAVQVVLYREYNTAVYRVVRADCRPMRSAAAEDERAGDRAGD
jgi:hypothetical protein